MYQIEGKVALVTGGASGIGFLIAQELFQNGLRGCTIADINEEVGQNAIETLNQNFGNNKAIFFKTDVSDKIQFEAAFKTTIEKFKNVDILVNNAGILDDTIWEREIQINLQGSINGLLLGMENYLQNYRTGSESVILNVASIAGLDPFLCFPIYTSTKFAVVGLTQAFGAQQHYDRTKVKVLAICPGITKTPLVAPDTVIKKTINRAYTALIEHDVVQAPSQEPECITKDLAKIISNGKPGSLWVVEGGKPAYEISKPSRQERCKI